MTDDPMMNDHLWALGHAPEDWGLLPVVGGPWGWLLVRGYIERGNDYIDSGNGLLNQVRLTDKGRAILRVRTPGPAALAAMEGWVLVPREFKLENIEGSDYRVEFQPKVKGRGSVLLVRITKPQGRETVVGSAWLPAQPTPTED